MTTTKFAASARNAKTSDLIAEWGISFVPEGYHFNVVCPNAEAKLGELLPQLHEARVDWATASINDALDATERYRGLERVAELLAEACEGTPTANEFERWFGRWGIYWEMEAGLDA